ncbi:MAG: HlyD family efflux transporter periplasmic adaptor subunit [Chloroflexales bacterium]|nr:HlyD family efflux transporter periplasmic adaptor subunit [Chloroflexales bacterium]
MQKWFIGIGVLIIIGIGLFFIATGDGSSALSEQAAAMPTPLPPVRASGQIIADAKVVPAQSVELAFETSGIVAEIVVDEGETVNKGAPLARLDVRDLTLRVKQAEAAFHQAQASYNQLLEGATPEEIAASEAQLIQAQAGLRQVRGSVTGSDIAAAQAQLEQARAALAQLLAGPKATQIESTQAAVAQAQANLKAQRDSLSAAKTSTQSQMEQAANALRDRQSEYGRIYWQNRELEDRLAEFGRELPQENQDAEATALRAVENAERALDQARVAYDQAREAEEAGIDAAEAQLRDTQAQRDQLLAGAEADQIAAARAQVSQAEANLSRLQGDERAGSLEAAEASVANARANLARITADPSAATLAVAKAQVESAQVILEQAELALEKATLIAPFDGTVAEVNLKVGEAPPRDQVTLVLADFSAWHIETDDLTELDVVRIREGDSVTISFDAIPELELPGSVSKIDYIGANRQGDIVYTVVVTPERWNPMLRWNMTATVAIDSSSQ